MNEELASTILSKPAIKLIRALPTRAVKATSIEELAVDVGMPAATVYRIMAILSDWDNVTSYKVESSHAPLTLYYIKSRNFTVTITNKGIQVKVDSTLDLAKKKADKGNLL